MPAVESTIDEFGDLLQVLLSPRVFEELAVDRNWPVDRYERELKCLLMSALTRPL